MNRRAKSRGTVAFIVCGRIAIEEKKNWGKGSVQTEASMVRLLNRAWRREKSAWFGHNQGLLLGWWVNGCRRQSMWNTSGHAEH